MKDKKEKITLNLAIILSNSKLIVILKDRNNKYVDILRDNVIIKEVINYKYKRYLIIRNLSYRNNIKSNIFLL